MAEFSKKAAKQLADTIDREVMRSFVNPYIDTIMDFISDCEAKGCERHTHNLLVSPEARLELLKSCSPFLMYTDPAKARMGDAVGQLVGFTINVDYRMAKGKVMMVPNHGPGPRFVMGGKDLRDHVREALEKHSVGGPTVKG